MISSAVPSAPAPPPGPPAPAPAEGFISPSPEDFNIPPIFETPALAWLDKLTIQLILSAVLIGLFMYFATKRTSLVPGRMQFMAERIHGFVRDGIARDQIGPEFRKYVPLLVTLFTFILINNYFGIVPGIQLPTFSHPGMAYALAAMVWLIYNGVGIQKHGFVGYLKHQTWPSGLPVAVKIVLAPIEALSNLIVRPITLALRLFATMFAGHLLLLVFAFGAEYMLLTADSVLLNVLSPFAAAGAIAIVFFEFLVMSIQAYVFTALTASYIGGAIAEEH